MLYTITLLILVSLHIIAILYTITLFIFYYFKVVLHCDIIYVTLLDSNVT